MTMADSGQLRRRALRLATLVALALPAAANAGGGQAFEQRSVTVRYGDLDLTRQEGVDTLHQRLRTAARNVCGSKDSRSVRSVQNWKACYSAALQRALTDAGLAILDASSGNPVVAGGK